MDAAPVLFIRKFETVIDIKDIIVRDELSDMEKKGTLTPQSLTQQKVNDLYMFLDCVLH